jgi:CheY-like chemotaxis protein
MAEARERKILVVDDEEDVVYFLCTALEDAGFRTESAASADEALEKVKASPPDLVSLDMVMPGKSGIVLFHALRKNPAWARIPVLFVTGHARDEKVKGDLDAAGALAGSTLSGPATYMEKPVTAAKFVAAVSKALGVGQGAASEEAPSAEDRMRAEIESLAQGADPDTLKKALDLLRKTHKP